MIILIITQSCQYSKSSWFPHLPSSLRSFGSRTINEVEGDSWAHSVNLPFIVLMTIIINTTTTLIIVITNIAITFVITNIMFSNCLCKGVNLAI